MRGMFSRDLEALEEISQCSTTPLVDCSGFQFFGGKDRHKWSNSLTSFATETFAAALTQLHPLLAAALKSFNDEFNVHLIEPADKIFKGSTLTDDERKRFLEMKKVFQSGTRHAVQEYAKMLVTDKDIFAKVVKFKRNTIRAYAGGGCDAPLCDQLVFLYEWLRIELPNTLAGMTEGTWKFNAEKGFSSVEDGGDGNIRAIQPYLSSPGDETSLMKMRCKLESNLLRFLSVNNDRQRIVSLLAARNMSGVQASVEQFSSFWKSIDPNEQADIGFVKELAEEVAGSNGNIDIHKFINWAVV